MGRSVLRAWCRRAAAMLWCPSRRSRVMAVLRRPAMTRGALPVRTWERSSSKVTSRTQWRRLYESARGAVPPFLAGVSPGRSSEPGVPVSRHRALHESLRWWPGLVAGTTGWGWCCPGSGIAGCVPSRG